MEVFHLQLLPPMYVHGDDSTQSPFIPIGMSMISDVSVKLLSSVIFQYVMCLEYNKRKLRPSGTVLVWLTGN